MWVYQTLPRWLPQRQDTQERLSSRWPAHPQACKCLCSSRRTCTAPLVVADRALACARLPVLAGATWPCAWFPPCAGSAPRCRPFQPQRRAEGNQAWRERSSATLPLLCPSPQQRGRAASSVRDAVRHRVAQAPLLRRAQVAFEGVRSQQHKGKTGK
jgi:hypothetical protein